MKSMQGRNCLHLNYPNKIDGFNMEYKKCYVCGKVLLKDETALTKKLIDKKTVKFYCISCLAEYLEVTQEELIAKIEEFKEEGCTLFK